MNAALALAGRIDRAWARVEGGLALVLLLALIVVGGCSAVLHGLARVHVDWAQALVARLDWSEPFLRTTTFWLAFLGASLGAQRQQHIAVDHLLRDAPPRAKLQLQAIAGFAGALLTAGLAVAFYAACLGALSERSVVYELIVASGPPLHVCDASDAQLARALAGAHRPLLTCTLRALLRACSLPSETPEAAFLLIAPLMLAVIALRLLGLGVRSARRYAAEGAR
jgi:TRAP-type C4-dicarboxylate transport system permease small subunit